MIFAADVVTALAHLGDRSGAKGLEVRWDCPHTPDAPDDDHNCPDVRWDASVTFRGARLLVDEMPSPSTAALALAERLLDGATCRCGQPVSLGGAPGCRWRLMADRWTPSCDAPPIHVDTGRGDLAGMNRAMRRQLSRQKGER